MGAAASRGETEGCSHFLTREKKGNRKECITCKRVCIPVHVICKNCKNGKVMTILDEATRKVSYRCNNCNGTSVKVVEEEWVYGGHG